MHIILGGTVSSDQSFLRHLFQQKHHKQQTGQVGVITLLIMAVILTIAISLSQRTTQEQQIAITQDESTRAFNAAESGVEQALSKIESEGVDINEVFQDTFTDDSNTAGEYSINPNAVFEMYLEENTAAEIPLDGSNTDVDIQWWYQRADQCSNEPAAIIVSIYNQTAYTARHLGYDPCATNHTNNFQEISVNSDPDYSFTQTITVTEDEILIRIRPLFNSARVRIESDAINKAQFNVNARAQSEQKTVAKAINVKRSRLGAPSFMDFSLVSGGNITKN